MERLKGADGHIYRLLGELAGSERRVRISQLDLAVRSGYTVPTVQAATRRLAYRGLVRLSPAEGRRPACYELAPADQAHQAHQADQVRR